MTPKKSSSLYKETSEEVNVSEAIVADIIEYYYKQLRIELSGLKHPRINVEGLGQFVLKERLVETYISKITKMIVNHDTSTFRAYHNKKAMEEKLYLLNTVSVEIEKERQRKVEFYKNKNNESSTQSNLGEQDTDS
jgi:nucleoid DNA-binding protein